MTQDDKQSPGPATVPLNQRISFRLQRVGSLLTAQAVTFLKRKGALTLNQWRLLSFLNERNGGSAHELAKLGMIDKATMSRAAAELQTHELIIAEPSATDRRKTVLHLTDTGREKISAITPMMLKRQAELKAALSEAEVQALFQILDKLENAIMHSELEIE